MTVHVLSFGRSSPPEADRTSTGSPDDADHFVALGNRAVDKGNRADNWTETSCSSMYAFTISRAVQRGYVDPSYKATADRGYRGVLATISLGNDGRTHLNDISVGTNVGNYQYYIDRARATNDFHGLGAFLIMNEQLRS